MSLVLFFSWRENYRDARFIPFTYCAYLRRYRGSSTDDTAFQLEPRLLYFFAEPPATILFFLSFFLSSFPKSCARDEKKREYKRNRSSVAPVVAAHSQRFPFYLHQCQSGCLPRLTDCGPPPLLDSLMFSLSYSLLFGLWLLLLLKAQSRLMKGDREGHTVLLIISFTLFFFLSFFLPVPERRLPGGSDQKGPTRIYQLLAYIIETIVLPCVSVIMFS